MTTYAIGARVFIAYDGYAAYHERLIVGHVAGALYMVCTPDFDVYPEVLDRTNPDLSAVRVSTRPGLPPVGVSPADVYGFRPLTPAEEATLVEEGRMLTDAERVALGLGPAGGAARLPAAAAAAPLPVVAQAPPSLAVVAAPAAGAPVPAPPVAAAAPPAALAPAGGLWVLDEPLDQHDVGTPFALPPGALQLGNRALVTIGTETAVLKLLPAGEDVTAYTKARQDFLSLDPRVLPREAGVTLQDALGRMEPSPWPADITFPLQGPATRHWWLDQVVESGYGTLHTRHLRWKTDSGVLKTDRCTYEHEVLSRMLDIAATRDMLNLKNMAWVEYALRRLQLIEEAVNEDPNNPTYEHARHYMGAEERKGGALMAPSLRAHVAAELGREAAILKERRKVREARLADDKRKPDKGKGKGRGAASGAAESQ